MHVGVFFSNSRRRSRGGEGNAALGALIADPGVHVDAGICRERFDCAVSTARDDLNCLVDLRYCSTAYQGKKQVF